MDSNNSSNSNSSGGGESARDEGDCREAFERRVRAATTCIPGPCSLDVCPGNVLRCSGFSSSQAFFFELGLVFGKAKLEEIWSVCEEAKLEEAFVIRNELVNFKKYCLRAFQRHQLVDCSLRRLSSLYFCDVVGSAPDDPLVLR
jgi:hypothetical protein